MPKKTYQKSEIGKLHDVFLKAAETGRRDHMKEASNQAKLFDNRHGTDFVGILSREIGCGCSYIRKTGEYTKSNNLREKAQEAFMLLAINTSNENKPVTQQSQVLSEQCRQPAL